MKVAIVNTYDSEGGAARAAYRLHKELQDKNVKSDFLSLFKSTDDYTVLDAVSGLPLQILREWPRLDRLPLAFYRAREKTFFSPAYLPSAFNVSKLNAYDIVNLHWINGGFLKIESIAKIKKPIVWTLHDSWPFTGGCHIPFDCDNYIKQCGNCNQLGSNRTKDLSNLIWKRKFKYWKDLNITIVTDSKWLKSCAERSSLFADNRIEVINPGLDTKVFKPLNKDACKKMLGLPLDVPLVLFGAMGATKDRNKGYQYLKPALHKLVASDESGRFQLGVFGASRPQASEDERLDIRYFGRLYDDISLCVLYSAADVMVVPSVQEAFGQTASESLACGTPVVAFDATGLTDSVEHRVNGYLAQPYDIDDLSYGISWVLADKKRHNDLCEKARETAVNKFDIGLIGAKYMDLYQELV
jgi:glycosyltransferase involved in cell wall biosynthesis